VAHDVCSSVAGGWIRRAKHFRAAMQELDNSSLTGYAAQSVFRPAHALLIGRKKLSIDQQQAPGIPGGATRASSRK